MIYTHGYRYWGRFWRTSSQGR